MTKSDDKKVPALRFKGFTDDWEQRKLNYFLATSSQRNSKNIYNKFNVLSVSGKYGIVNQIKLQGRSFAGKSLSNYKIVNTNDIVYTKSPIKSNPYGIIRTNKQDKGIVSTLYAVYHPTKFVFPNFIELYFSNNLRLNKYLKPIVNIGAKHDMKVANEEVINHKVIFPTVNEQKAINELFLKLDKLLSLQQRKLNTLFQYKSQFVNDIFEKQNSNWKTKRLNEFLHVPAPEISNVTTKEQIMTVKLNVGGVVSGASRDTLKLSATKYYVRHAGQLIFGKQNFFNGSIAIVPQNMDGKVTSQDVPSLNIDKDKIDSYFLLYYLSRKNFYEHTERFATGTGSKRLHVETVLNLKIKVPSINMQKKISSVISKINADIQAELKKLNMYKKIKQSLLQNMFI